MPRPERELSSPIPSAGSVASSALVTARPILPARQGEKRDPTLRIRGESFSNRSYHMVTVATMIPTEALLGTPLKIRILRFLARYPDRTFTQRELGRFVGASHVGVGKALEDLLAYDIVRRQVVGRAYGVSANRDSALFTEVANLFEAEKAMLGRLRNEVRRWCRRHPEVLYAALFGSYARGQAGPRSDIDLLLVARNPQALEKDLDSLREAARTLLGRPLAPLLATPQEIARRRNSTLLRAIRSEGVTLYRRNGWTLP